MNFIRRQSKPYILSNMKTILAGLSRSKIIRPFTAYQEFHMHEL